MTDMLDDIGICIGTLGADPLSVAQDLPAVLDAVAASGTRSVSLHSFLGMMYGADGVAKMLTTAGLRAGALEAALAWSSGPSDAARAEAEQIAEMSNATGARAVLTVVLEAEMNPARASDGLAQLCEVIAPTGAMACLEWLPWTAMATIADAHRLLDASGADNCGITFDTWHWMRQPGGPDLDALASMGVDRVGYLQLCDVAATAASDVFDEAMHARLLPGDGIVDFDYILATLITGGATPYVASEVFNDAILATGARAAASTIHDACARLAR